MRPVGLEPTRRKGHQSLNLACLPKFHHGHIIFDYQQANPHKRDQPVRPVGLEPTHPNKRGTGLSFRRVYHSTTGAKASQSRRTTGNYRSIISRPPARAQAEKRDPTPPKQTPHRTHTAKARGTTMLRGPCRTRTRPRHPCTSSGAHTKTIPLTKTRPAKPCGGQPTALNSAHFRTRTMSRSAAGIEPAPQAVDLCSSLYGFCTRLSYALWTVQDSNL